jgi:SOS-response transcriptional repressor LexA
MGVNCENQTDKINPLRASEVARHSPLPIMERRFEVKKKNRKPDEVVLHPETQTLKPSQSCIDLANQIEETIETDCKDPNAFAFILDRNCMAPRFIVGDYVVCAPNLEPRDGDPVIAKLHDGTIYFGRFQRFSTNLQCVRLTFDSGETAVEFEGNKFAFVYPVWEMRRRERK